MISEQRTRMHPSPHNYPHRLKSHSSALRIIAERSTKGETRDLLLQDLVSRDKTQRNKALNALYFLVSNRARMASVRTSETKFLLTRSISLSHLHLLPAAGPPCLYRTNQLSLQSPGRTYRGDIDDCLTDSPKDQAFGREESAEYTQYGPTRKCACCARGWYRQSLAGQVPLSVRHWRAATTSRCRDSYENVVVG